MSIVEPKSLTRANLPEVLIEPEHGWVALKLRDLWQYRELLYFLIWRDVKVRYKQTALGAAWAIIQPLFTMIIFTVFFGGLAKMPSDGVPYWLFSYTALIPWTFFANGLQHSTNSLVENARVITKVYFPRLVIPVSAVLAGAIDFVLAFVMLLGMMLLSGNLPLMTINVVWLPLFLLLALVTSLGAGLWFSALNVQFRDVRYIVPFLVQVWLYATPIAYSSTMIKSDVLRALYGLNPMAGVVEGFRWALLGVDTAPGPIILVSTLAALILFASGAFYFRRVEKSFADVV
jgi:lipopolysaccharide transport system permease protein